ncbi:MAG: hypothetical protein QG671_4308 [Actinomycetota bacterium]|nr:hypothetical protein [Actinomycetota bacterium]
MQIPIVYSQDFFVHEQINATIRPGVFDECNVPIFKVHPSTRLNNNLFVNEKKICFRRLPCRPRRPTQRLNPLLQGLSRLLRRGAPRTTIGVLVHIYPLIGRRRLRGVISLISTCRSRTFRHNRPRRDQR